MAWTPRVTVAAVVERDGRFLVVEEAEGGRRVLNQPAGHWEPGETLVQACARETLEETGWTVAPRALIAVYDWRAPSGDSYLRFTFAAEPLSHDAARALDPDIFGARWMSTPELDAARDSHRSPPVWRSVADYLDGRRHPLELLAGVA